MIREQRAAYKKYNARLGHGMSRELARTNLPLNLYTEWYWQCDLHNLLHFLGLRMDAHAQRQIRVYAEAMAVCAKAVAPLAYDAFEQHRLNAVTFSQAECVAMSLLLNGQPPKLEGKALEEFEKKLAKMQAMPVPVEV